MVLFLASFLWLSNRKTCGPVGLLTMEPLPLVLVLLGGIQPEWIQGVVLPQNHQELH